MITIDREYEVAIWLRQKIIDMIAGVEDASGIRWDNTSPNWMTKSAIEQLSDALAGKLKSLEVIQIHEHAPCGSGQHEALAKFSMISTTAYWRLVLEDGRTDAHTVKNGKLFVDGIYMENSEPEMTGQKIICPCCPEKPKDHTVAIYHAWPNSKDNHIGMFYKCLSILGDAKSHSGPKMRRSAVREQLLKCVIILNDAITSVSVDEHMAKRVIC